VDLGESSCVEQVQAVHAVLREKHVTLTERWEAAPSASEPGNGDPFALRLPALMLANKSDLAADEVAEVEAFRELTGFNYPALAVSATTGEGLAQVGAWLFGHLGIVRVYTKTPGKPAEKDRPFTLRGGQTIEDVARLVHKDLAHSLKYARVWGKTGIPGQHVGREHKLADGDVVELHT
jgi:ribosome-interacting GTPase 1